MKPRQLTASRAGFVQGVVNLLNHGYVYFVQGEIAEAKDPGTIDRKLARKYDTEITRWERSRRRSIGVESVRYLRFGRSFILMAQPGRGPFFEEEPFKDARRLAIHFEGYVISYRKSTATRRWHASVAIERTVYLGLKAHLLQLSTHRSVDGMTREFQRIPFEPFARVKRQYFQILRAVNRKRFAAGFAPVPNTALRLFRRRPKVYAELEAMALPGDKEVGVFNGTLPKAG